MSADLTSGARRPRSVGLNPDHLRELRARRGWTQHDLAAKSHLSQSMVAGLESGYRNAGPHTLAKLAVALRPKRNQASTDATRAYLLAEEDGDGPPTADD